MKDKDFYRRVFAFLFDGYITRSTSEVMAYFDLDRNEAVDILNELCAHGLADEQLIDRSGMSYSHRRQRPGIEMLWSSRPNDDVMDRDAAIKVFDEKFK